MFRTFEAPTADEVWRQLASAFRNTGVTTRQSSRAGETLEALHSTISIANPIQRWVASRLPPINPAFAIAEVVWLMNGRNDAPFLNYFNRQLPKYAGHGPVYHGAYGFRLRRHLALDQLNRAYSALAGKRDTRQVVLQIWDSKVDLPDHNGQAASPDIPCNVLSLLLVREGKLQWTQILRSNDLFRGLPYNLVQFTTLQEVVAGWLDLNVGDYNQVSNSLHIYTADLEHIAAFSPSDAPANIDSLALPKPESERCFHELGRNVEAIISEDTTANSIMRAVHGSHLPGPFRNMLCVLSAEGCRRRRRPDAAHDIMAHCTNPIYQVLFDRWAGARRGDRATSWRDGTE